MPHGKPAAGVRRIEGGDPCAIGSRGPDAVGHDDERAHLVMDVASEGYDAWLVEMHRRRLRLGEQLELEPLGRGERVNVVLGVIEVRERHVRADRDDRQERMELQVLLRNDVASAAARRSRAPPGWIESDNGIADRMPGWSTTRTVSGAAPTCAANANAAKNPKNPRAIRGG